MLYDSIYVRYLEWSNSETEGMMAAGSWGERHGELLNWCRVSVLQDRILGDWLHKHVNVFNTTKLTLKKG